MQWRILILFIHRDKLHHEHLILKLKGWTMI